MKAITIFIQCLILSFLSYGQDIMFEDGRDALLISVDGSNYNREFHSEGLSVGYLFSGRLQLDVGFGGVQDGIRQGIFHFDGYAINTGASYLLLKQNDEKMPINFKPSVKYQMTHVYGSNHKWINAGAYVSREFQVNDFWLIPSVGFYWNEADGSSSSFIRRGGFESYEFALTFYMNGGYIKSFYNLLGRDEYSFGFAVGGAL